MMAPRKEVNRDFPRFQPQQFVSRSGSETPQSDLSDSQDSVNSSQVEVYKRKPKRTKPEVFDNSVIFKKFFAEPDANPLTEDIKFILYGHDEAKVENFA